jgi:hypothetical protein
MENIFSAFEFLGRVRQPTILSMVQHATVRNFTPAFNQGALDAANERPFNPPTRGKGSYEKGFIYFQLVAAGMDPNINEG